MSRRLLIRVWRTLLALVVPLTLVLGAATGAAAAEVLQVRTATLLQVGDQNRSYSVALACVDLAPAEAAAARDWLRADLPRRTRVNLRPLGADQGLLVAHVQRLDRGTDLASDLMAAGYGQRTKECGL